MRGQRPILEAALAAARRGEPAVLATVVRVAGSSYRRPGARMLFPAEGPPVGFISGGCLEADPTPRHPSSAATAAADRRPRPVCRLAGAGSARRRARAATSSRRKEAARARTTTRGGRVGVTMMLASSSYNTP